jgi:hypothetical protein
MDNKIDNKAGRAILSSGPALGRNPITEEKYDYGSFDSKPRSIEFTVANGKQYRGVQLRDGRWKVHEVQ